MTTPTTVQVQIQLRADTAANWTAQNPTLLNNELALETDTKKLKVGNGSTAWNSLAYFPFVVSGGTVLGNLEIGSTGTLTFEGSTADGFETTLGVVNPTADRTINLPNQSGTVIVSGNASIVDADISASAEIAVSKLADGAARQLLQTDAAGTGVEWASNIDVPGTLDVTGAATFDSSVTIAGDLTVNGTTTNINTQNLVVEDKNIILADVATPTDVTADGGGITLKGATDKTINWVDATDAWTLSEHVNIASGKEYRIDGTKVLDATSLGSSVLITSANITDGTIVDGDINSSAAIAGTKISPDFGSQTVQTTGIFSHALGTATAPTVTFTGDLNSGIYSPGADQVAIATNGTQKLNITSAGQATFTTTGTTGAIFNTASNGFIRVTDGTIQLNLQNTGSAGNLTTVTEHPLILRTFNQERLRITSDGKLGLGTSAPGTNLEIRKDTASTFYDTTIDTTILLSGTPGAGSGNFGGSIGFSRLDSVSRINAAIAIKQTSADADQCGLSFFTHPATTTGASLVEQLSITHAGNVGIGTTAPTAALAFGNVVDTNGYDVSRIRLYDNLSGSIAGFGVSASQLNYRAPGAHVWYDGTSEKARIDSSGRLLVGTSSDSGGALLQVNGDRVRIGTAKTPASASATGTTGEICWDASYIYVCTATNTWKRAALATW